jgi:hypothetical protein
MTRILLLSLPALALAACGPAPSRDNSVDINAAASEARDSVDAYGANSAAENDAPVDVAEPDAPTEASNAVANSNANALAPLDPPAPGTPGGLPDDRTPISEAPFTPDSAQGAANVVQTYYALIGEGKYAQAYALREKSAGPASAAAFAGDFARYSEYHANVGAPGRVDAGAGQRYVTVPVQVYARLKAGGTPVYQIGSVVLHRAGDIDGATKEQRSWHIQSIALKPAPKR